VGKYPWRGDDAGAVQFEPAATEFKIVIRAVRSSSGNRGLRFLDL
jgi:hypothetical protein